MASAAELHRRRERKVARRSHRLTTGNRPRRMPKGRLVEEGVARFEELMASIRAQSKPRQKVLDKEAARRCKRREGQAA